MYKMSLLWFVVAFLAIPATGTELKQNTAAAFDRYIRGTEARMQEDAGQDRFLAIDRLPEPRRHKVYDHLLRGEIYIEALRTREDDRSIAIPGGLIHHWVGVIFVPEARLSQALAVLEDYEHQQEIYKPDIRQSKLIEQTGEQSKIFLQFFNKSVVIVVLNANFDVSNTPFGSTRQEIAFRSTRIVEVANPGKADQHELPAGNDHGYLWRLNTYWRIEEKDGGVYVQNESVALTRTVPVLLAWLVNPLIRSIPRNILLRLLNATRKAVVKARLPAPADRLLLPGERSVDDVPPLRNSSTRRALHEAVTGSQPLLKAAEQFKHLHGFWTLSYQRRC
jgi:hypothetical protein